MDKANCYPNYSNQFIYNHTINNNKLTKCCDMLGECIFNKRANAAVCILILQYINVTISMLCGSCKS